MSDVYQDMFSEGSFIGKGIYDVDAFERALKGRFPDNRILSHDLVESCYARSALLTDVQVYEEYPARYSADVSRRHRWIRGDWQLLRWLLPWVPGAAGRRGNRISALSRWKLFDNLRRSLVPAVLTLLLLFSWALLPLPGFWTLVVLGIVLIPGFLACAMDFLHKPREVLWAQHMTSTLRCTATHLSQGGFTMACLPYEAYYSLDAIVRTLWRMTFSRRRLLEWNVFREADPQSRQQPGGILADHVDRSRAGTRHCGLSYGGTAHRAAGGVAALGALVRVTQHRLVDQPPGGAASGAPDRGAKRLSAQARPQDLGFL